MASFDVSGLPDVPRDTLEALTETVGNFLVVGMTAVDLVTRGLGGMPASRLTRDVDIAIAVDSEEAFRRRTRALVPRDAESSVHFWLGTDQVDVVPFGALASDDRVTLSDQHLDVSGLEDAARIALDLRVDDDLVVRVASLPALVVLKLIAWTDRATETDDKDARDVGLLLRASSSGWFADELWSDDVALVRAGYDPERAGPLRVGQQIVQEFPVTVVSRLLAVLEGPSGQRLQDVLSRGDAMSRDRVDGLLLGLRTTTSAPDEQEGRGRAAGPSDGDRHLGPPPRTSAARPPRAGPRRPRRRPR